MHEGELEAKGTEFQQLTVRLSTTDLATVDPHENVAEMQLRAAHDVRSR